MVRYVSRRTTVFGAAVVPALLLVFLTAPGLCARHTSPVVIVTTTAIQSIVAEVGKGIVDAVSLIPPDSCPGHFDLRPGDAAYFNSAQLLLAHTFEKDTVLKSAQKLKQEKGPLRIVAVAAQGSWMVPDVYMSAIDEISSILAGQFPSSADAFSANAAAYKKRIALQASRIKDEAKKLGIDRITVVANEMQADLLKWLGVNVAASYGRQDDMGVSDLRVVIDRARASGARAVVDNLQSSPGAGKPVADELRIPHLVLSNFPGIYNGAVSYPDTLEENSRAVLKVVNR